MRDVLQREVPLWVAVVAVIIIVLIVVGVYVLRRPKTRPGMSPPPEAPIRQIPGPAQGGMMPPAPPQQAPTTR